MNFPRLALAAALFLPGFLHAAADIIVEVDMTPEGRKIVHPTPEHPAYYLPVMRGFQESADLPAGEKPVSEHEVVKLAATELARQGYRAIDDQHRTADLVIDLSWGQIGPMDEGLATQQSQAKMQTLLFGRTITNIAQLESVGHDELMEETRSPRYYVIVTAYDYAAWSKQHQHVLLWIAKMSIPSSGVFLENVIAPLIKAGGPNLGRETVNRPLVLPSVPEGRVEIGTPTVKNDPGSPPPANAK